jgi:hypothetical protein
VFGIIFYLFFPAAVGFFQRGFNGTGHTVGVKNDFTLGIAGSPADGLNQRTG